MKYLITFIILGIFLTSTSVLAQKKKNIKYKYKKYEKFDFESMSIAGDKSSPGDISISNRFKHKFKNKIPRKPNLNNEMKASLDAIL